MVEAIINILIGAAVIYALWRMFQRFTHQSIIRVGNKNYDYIIGNGIAAEQIESNITFVSYNGMSIRLDREMPHIYLDSHNDSKISGPRFYIPRTHKVSLEGDFDKYFQLYAKEGYRQLALSIISPDVMAKLIDEAHRFDIEIKGQQLRVISSKLISKNPAKQEAMQDAAAAVLAEIAHRMKSWPKHQSFADSVLPAVYERSGKIGRRSFRLAWAVCALIGFMFIFTWLIMAFWADPTIANVSGAGRWIGLVVAFFIPFSVVWMLEFAQKKFPKQYRAFTNFIER